MTLTKSLLLTALLGLPTASLADGYSGTFTGKNGGTVAYSGACAVGDDSVTCERESLLTGPNGKTATRELDRVWTKGKVATSIVTKGEGGRSVTTTRERLR